MWCSQKQAWFIVLLEACGEQHVPLGSPDSTTCMQLNNRNYFCLGHSFLESAPKFDGFDIITSVLGLSTYL